MKFWSLEVKKWNLSKCKFFYVFSFFLFILPFCVFCYPLIVVEWILLIYFFCRMIDKPHARQMIVQISNCHREVLCTYMIYIKLVRCLTSKKINKTTSPQQIFQSSIMNMFNIYIVDSHRCMWSTILHFWTISNETFFFHHARLNRWLWTSSQVQLCSRFG